MSSSYVILDVAARGVLYCTVPVLAGIFVYNRLTLGRCTSENQLKGKTVIITGANSGIGYETAKELARRGARVIIGCRNRSRAENAVKKLINETGNTNICWKELDTSSLKSVRAFADEVLSSEKKIHILINNAGIPGPKEKCMTEEGLEVTLATNYVGHFLLTNLLLPTLVDSAPSRIINLSSVAHFFGKLNFDDLQMEKKYNGDQAYTNSKLAVVLFTKELSRRLSGTGVTVNSVHPGVVDTPLAHGVTKVGGSAFNFFGRLFGTKSAEEGAQTSIHVAVSEEGGQLTGKYFTDCKPKLPWAIGQSEEKARKLWEATVKLTGLQAAF
ncbi:retinol dehydrogenase 12-like [Ornithodoros turicata]|uniref:retinol dehydrogenase 12-like n=1 Tax=Ornithodoros turicata TaxID=34597 RepID=UPI0031389AD3